MPDTGAPWNIPYVASSDLVSDWPTDSQDLAQAVADGLALSYNQVVQTVKTDTFSTTSNTFTPVTGLSASITPAATSSKVLIIAQVSFSLETTASVGHFRLAGGNAGDYVGDAASGRIRGVFAFRNMSDDQYYSTTPGVMVYLDSPATAASVTYSVETMSSSVTAGTVYVNISGRDFADDRGMRSASSITLIEVPA